MVFKKILKSIKEYETIENNSRRLEKGYKPKLMINNLWNVLYEKR